NVQQCQHDTEHCKRVLNGTVEPGAEYSNGISGTHFKLFEKGDYIMQAITSRVQRFLESEDGPTASEDAALVGLVIVALVTVISNFTGAIKGTFNSVSTTLSTASGS